jgi:SAM-dependent methyltransferase
VSASTPRLFAYVQGAGFYRQLLADALAALGAPDGRSLLDVSCGPGALTSIAARAGFTATGIDADPAMISLARTIARRERVGAEFATKRLEDAAGRHADVIVAASLLATSSDPFAAVNQLRRLANPGGRLLIIEATPRMTTANARALMRRLPGPRRATLLLWALARRGQALDQDVIGHLEVDTRHDHDLLNGLVTATLLEPSNPR